MRSVAFSDIFEDVSRKYSRIPNNRIGSSGTFPVIDQGSNSIAGYQEDASLSTDLGPVVIFGDHTRIVKYAEGPFTVGADGTKVLRPKDGIHPKFAFHWLKSQKIISLGYSRHFKLLKELSAVFPALDEQKRLANILDKADALGAKRREAIAHLDALSQSIFHKMFGGGAETTAILGDILKVSSGKFLPAKSMTMGGQYPVYGGNGINGYHDQYIVDEATLVIGRVGANCGAVHLTQPKSWITDNALRVRKLRPMGDDYLLFALRQANLNQYANVSGQPSISGAAIYGVSIPVPALELQQEFAGRVSAVECLKAKHHVQLAALDNLFLSLQDRAFRGEL